MKLLTTIIPYLLLVSFYTGTLKNFGIDKINAINASPYNGVAVPLIGAYDTKKYTIEDFNEQVDLIKKYSKKDIWPWLFFNRFIGYDKGNRAHSPLADRAYFTRIKGMDIYNKSGAHEDFLNLFRISLKIARKFGSPGIVIDPGAYNNYKAYNPSYVAKKLGITEEELIKRLKQIGQKMADIANEEYTEATIWFLFTGLSSPLRSFIPFEEKKYRTVSYIIEGMLERIKEKHFKLKVISGGEVSLGYCYKNIEDLRNKIKCRNEKI